MQKQIPGKIYLADQCGLLETSEFRRQSTFNFGAYQHAHKEAFGRLYGLNEETLAGGHEVEFTVSQASYVVLLPLTGAVAFSVGGASGLIDAGALATLAVPAGTMLRLRNPYDRELISLLHLWVQAAGPLAAAPVVERSVVFDEPQLENRLRELVGFRDAASGQPGGALPLPFALSLGRFMGRQEAAYQVQQAGNGLFAFVIAGAFELEGRLLHEKDGVALWEAAEIELEALSNHALVLVVELAS